jgi:DNA modification methylase
MFSNQAFCKPTTVQYVIFSGTDKKYRHPKNWQQPIGESVYFIENLTRPGSLICDLFVGSGTVPTAVAMVGGGRRFVGCDSSLTCVKIARKRVWTSIGGVNRTRHSEKVGAAAVTG